MTHGPLHPLAGHGDWCMSRRGEGRVRGPAPDPAKRVSQAKVSRLWPHTQCNFVLKTNLCCVRAQHRKLL